MRSWTSVYPALSISLILLHLLPCFGRTSHIEKLSAAQGLRVTRAFGEVELLNSFLSGSEADILLDQGEFFRGLPSLAGKLIAGCWIFTHMALLSRLVITPVFPLLGAVRKHFTSAVTGSQQSIWLVPILMLRSSSSP